MWIGHRKEIQKLIFWALALVEASSSSLKPIICSDEGLTLETSASESLYHGQFTISTQLIKPNYLVILPPLQQHSFFRNLSSLFKYCYFDNVWGGKYWSQAIVYFLIHSLVIRNCRPQPCTELFCTCTVTPMLSKWCEDYTKRLKELFNKYTTLFYGIVYTVSCN